MTFLEHVSLAPHTSFKIGGPARFFCIVKTVDELKAAVLFANSKKVPFFILGGGSNILISDKGFAGLVIKMEITGISLKVERSKKGEENTIVIAGAGESWDGLVKYAVLKGLGGIENLSLIPGTVGAAPIQNIGAYGSEVKDAIWWVEVLDVKLVEITTLSKNKCAFRYRSSIFKDMPGRYIVTRVAFKLSKDAPLNIEYRDVQEWYRTHADHPRTIAGVRDAVVAIRTAKLPDLKQWGTAGSFFKNPIIAANHYSELKKKYPEMPGFPEADGRVKVPLGWILDKVCNAKGLKAGNVSTYEKQALVLVATPGATAAEVDKLAIQLTDEVNELTGIVVEREVEYIGV